MNPLFIEVPGALAAAGAFTYSALHPRSQFFGRTICRTNSPRKLAITFDDGPNPAITPKLLDLLAQYNASATFFLIGRYVRECPDLVKETVARGHTVGNHTETHPNLLWQTPTQVRIELRLCHDAISHAIGAAPKWFRPPFGMRNPWVIRAARELAYSTVMWTLLPLIVQSPDAARLTARPDDAVPLTPKSGSPHVLSASAPKLIVWSARPTVRSLDPLLAT